MCGSRGKLKNWIKREIKKTSSNLSVKRRRRRARREARLQEGADQEGEAQEGEAEGEAQEGEAQAQEGEDQEYEEQYEEYDHEVGVKEEDGESTEESILMRLADLAASSGPAASSASSWE